MQDPSDALAWTVATDIARLATWTEDERPILRAVFTALARGHPVEARDVADAAARPLAEVQDILGRHDAQLQRDAHGIYGWMGLTLRPTAHRVEIEDVQVYTWCALDPYFIAPILGKTLKVTSTAPRTKSQVCVTIRPDGTFDAPRRAAATLVHRGQDALAADVIANFCRFVHHFPSEADAHAYNPGGVTPVVVPVGALAKAGQALYQEAWA